MIQESVSTYNPEVSSGEQWLKNPSGTDIFSQFETENLDAPWTIKSDDVSDRLKLYSADLLSSTKKEEEHLDLHHQIDDLFDIAKDEEFEDGIENKFSKLLIAFIEKYEKKAIEELTLIFIKEEKNAEIISEALRWIGRMDQNATHSDRLWLILRCLFCSSPYIRDGALLGIESMNDLGAINSLKQAIKNEKYLELKKDMEKVLYQLEANLNGVNFKDC
jgi:hypothetical protein